MLRKKLSELEEGTVLADDVKDDSGRLLIVKGTRLSESLISRLQRIGVIFVYIESEENFSLTDEEDDHLFEKEFQEIEARVNKKFEAFCEHPVMSHIALCAKRYLKLRLKKGSRERK